MQRIEFYDEKNEFGEFSNYFLSNITIDGKRYPTVEHYFQSQKFIGSKDAEKYAEIIREQSTPNKAKILANQRQGGGYKWRTDLNPIIQKYKERGVEIRPDWEDIKMDVMRKGLLAKFSTPPFNKILLDTGDAILIEHTTRDKIWGDGGDGSGQNLLGKLLMETREKLRNTPPPSVSVSGEHLIKVLACAEREASRRYNSMTDGERLKFLDYIYRNDPGYFREKLLTYTKK